MKAYIVTGAPGTGKTSLINELTKDGFIGLEEVPRKLIKSGIAEEMGISPFEDLEAFAELVFNKMHEQFLSAAAYSKTVFFDRALPDVIGYLNQSELPVKSEYLEIIKKCDFQKTVFYCPVWKDIYTKDRERPYHFTEASSLDRYIYNAYKSLDFELKILPKASISARKNFVLNYI